MRKEAAVQSVNDQVEGYEVVPPVIEKKAPAVTETAPAETRKPVAAAVVEKVAAKPKATKKAAAEKSVPTPKALAKPVKKAAVAAKEEVAEVAKTEKATKVKKQAPKKPKLVRDSFTIPESDYALFATIKERALIAGVDVKKSEVLRAALVTLAKLEAGELIKAIGLVERIKTGRPQN